MIKIGIIGGAGYTAGELLRLLVNHPDAEIKWIHSSSNAGNPVSDVHQGLIGEIDMKFTDTPALDEIDLLFCCTPHGDTRKFMDSHDIPEGLKIIDLSTDYRIEDGTHDFVYGLPELNRKRIVRGATRVANPGCFATAIQLALLPLAAAGKLSGEVHVTGITGSTGAGVKPGSTTHFSWRNNNISVYKAFEHQHLKEIKQTLSALDGGKTHDISFIPVRGDFARGIFVMADVTTSMPLDEAVKLYKDFYADAEFTHVSDRPVDLKQVVNTNKCVVSLEKHGDKLLILSAIDNLLKGASGQAVQNMNLMFALPEHTGLALKPSAF